jgi:hypothetical protein
LQWKTFVCFSVIWSTYFMAAWLKCVHLVYFPILVCMDQEKSGNPDSV